MKMLHKISDLRYEIHGILPSSQISLEARDSLKKALPKNVFFDPLFYKGHSFHSNPLKQRYEEIANAFNNPKCKVIWAVGGGYGSSQLSSLLLQDLQKWPKEKVLIGYSDITSLHLIFEKEKMRTIHGMCLREGLFASKDPLNFQYLLEILKGKKTEISYNNLISYNQSASLSQDLEGDLIGGNATLIQTSLGTPFEIQTQNRILFLEDVNMQAYQIDRCLRHLYQAGIFRNIHALILGNFYSAKTPENERKVIESTLKRIATELQKPVFRAHFIGHSPQNYPLIIREKAFISKKDSHFSLSQNMHLFVPF